MLNLLTAAQNPRQPRMKAKREDREKTNFVTN